MNIIPNPGQSVRGVVLAVTDEDFPALLKREVAYDMVNVTDQITPRQPVEVFTFIAPDTTDYQGKKVYKAYLDICLEAVPEKERQQWLEETIIECEVSTESRPSVYKAHGQ
jgi:hypothetical protein